MIMVSPGFPTGNHLDADLLHSWQALDSDSTDEKIVLNRIMPLKEDSGKTI